MDPTAPIIINSKGEIVQMSGKITLTSTKKYAKILAERKKGQVTVYIPHTTYEQQPPPIKETKHPKPKTS
jgi:hypothetical protein